MTESTEPPPPLWAPPPPVPAQPLRSQRAYRRPGRLRVMLLYAIAVAIGAAGATTAASLRVYSVVRDLQTSPADASVQRLRDFDQQQIVISLVAFGVILAAHGFLIAWTARLYRNLRAFGVTDQRYTDGWAVGAWFVPFLNLARPKNIIDDIWRASGVDSPREHWRSGPVPTILHAWWIAVIGSYLVPMIGRSQQSPEGTFDLDVERTGAMFGVLGGITVLVALTLELVAVHRISTRHEAAARRLGVDDAGPPANARSVALGAFATALVLGIAAGSVTANALTDPFSDDEAEATTTDRGGDVFVYDLQVGHCFDNPDGVGGSDTVEMLAVSLTGCDEPHDSEVYSVYDLPGDDDTAYLGDGFVFGEASDGCASRFDDAIGTSYERSSLGVFVMYPTETTWRAGDRRVICIATAGDGSKLDATVIDSGL